MGAAFWGEDRRGNRNAVNGAPLGAGIRPKLVPRKECGKGTRTIGEDGKQRWFREDVGAESTVSELQEGEGRGVEWR